MKITSKIILLFLAAALIAVAVPARAITQETPTRTINVVYDDSGSMIKTGGALVDTWCQAKYAMEVFSAMLGERDIMNIFVMSDFDDRSTAAGPRIILNGSDGMNVNVAKIHDMLTTASNTPFNTVRKAYEDLISSSSDEKWLVVLTDGEFQGVSDIDGFFAKKEPDVNVMFLSMGPSAGAITPNGGQHIYFEKAQTNSEILSKITSICTRIFNSDRLNVNVSTQKFSFDVPMGELVVFAQGANVTIKGINSPTGQTIPYSSLPVDVRYSERAATNYNEAKIAKELTGSIATFKGDFPAGDYTVDVSGAETIEVYYKPNIEITAYLIDADGNEVTEMEVLKAGEYTIAFGFVKAGTKDRVSQSALLGNVTYAAEITNNGVKCEKAYASGDKVTLAEGSLHIDVTAHFLEYNSVSTSLEYAIYTDKGIEFSVLEEPVFNVTKDGLDASAPICIKASMEGQPLTPEQWAEIGVPAVVLADEAEFELGMFTIEKSVDIGVFNVYPSLAEGETYTGIYTNRSYTLSYSEKHGDSTWSGGTSGTLKLADNRTWFERNFESIIKLVVMASIVLFLLGYIPPFKRYLPRRLKKRPAIDCKPNMPGVRAMKANGKYKKKLLPTLVPYRAERGTIKFMPPGAPGVPILKVKAAGGSAMYITNVRDYAGKDHIAFDGTPVEKEKTKPMRKSAGVMITVRTKEITYTCTPSMK